MTLQQAFTEWAAIPNNTALAASCRSAVNAVLTKTYGSCDVRQFTAYYTRLLFRKCNEPQSFKTKAASILVHVLEYAASKGKCMRPEFDFGIASEGMDEGLDTKDSPNEAGRNRPPSDDVSPNEHVADAEPAVAPSGKTGPSRGKHVLQVDPGTGKVVAVHDSMTDAGRAVGCTAQNIKLAIKKGHKAMGFYWCPDPATHDQISALLSGKDRKERILEFNKSKRIPVSQLDPDTLEVVATFESIAAASEALGIKSQANINFALRNHSLAKGYYWCAEGMEKGFKPGAKRILGKPDPVTRTPLSLFSDEELKEELRRRGWRGSVYMRMDL